MLLVSGAALDSPDRLCHTVLRQRMGILRFEILLAAGANVDALKEFGWRALAKMGRGKSKDRTLHQM